MKKFPSTLFPVNLMEVAEHRQTFGVRWQCNNIQFSVPGSREDSSRIESNSNTGAYVKEFQKEYTAG